MQEHGRIIDQLAERGIISGYQGSNPREVLMTKNKWQELNHDTNKIGNITYKIEISNVKRLNDEEYDALKRQKKLDLMIREELMNLHNVEMMNYGINIDYNRIHTLDNIHNCLITDTFSDNPKIEILEYISQYNPPEEVKVILIGNNSLCFNTYNGMPNLLIPVLNDKRKIQGLLAWANQEIHDRYSKYLSYRVKNIYQYNQKNNVVKMPQKLMKSKTTHQIVKSKMRFR